MIPVSDLRAGDRLTRDRELIEEVSLDGELVVVRLERGGVLACLADDLVSIRESGRDHSDRHRTAPRTPLSIGRMGGGPTHGRAVPHPHRHHLRCPRARGPLSRGTPSHARTPPGRGASRVPGYRAADDARERDEVLRALLITSAEVRP